LNSEQHFAQCDVHFMDQQKKSHMSMLMLLKFIKNLKSIFFWINCISVRDKMLLGFFKYFHLKYLCNVDLYSDI
jgi:hypothetical protein